MSLPPASSLKQTITKTNWLWFGKSASLKTPDLHYTDVHCDSVVSVVCVLELDFCEIQRGMLLQPTLSVGQKLDCWAYTRLRERLSVLAEIQVLGGDNSAVMPMATVLVDLVSCMIDGPEFQ